MFSGFINAQSQGEKLFKENKPKEAVQVLENEILNNQISANTYNFLGLGYYQLEEYAKSLEAFDRGIKAQPSNVKLLSFNKGNTYYAMKDYTSAISAYSQAYLDDATFYDALLNRANAFLMADQLNNAKTDYELFIEKCPQDSQRPKIEALIQALIDEMARREEEARLLAEQNKALWEKIDPSIDNKQLKDSTEWELVDASIEESPEEKGNDWQKVDAAIENNKTDKKPDWQEVDASISDNAQKKKTDWESIEEIQGNDLEKGSEKDPDSSEEIAENQDSSSDSDKLDWEKLEMDKMSNIGTNNDEELYEDDEELANKWENLSDEENMELKRLEKESKEAHEKWLAEQSLLRQKEAEEELKKLQEKDDKERLAREKLLKELMEAEEARRKKLLDDVANSLQNSDSTNMTSGADDLLEYEQEGVLD